MNMTYNYKYITLFILIFISNNLYSKTLDLPLGMALSISGYLGYREIYSKVDVETLDSRPEIGILANLKLTDRLTFFNQFAWGTNINQVFVYNQLAYTPDLTFINKDVEAIFKVGKLRYNYGLYNQTRVNPRTRQGVFQPQAIYWDSVGESLTSGLGVGLDLNYKSLKLTYLIDKQTIINAGDEADDWLGYEQLNNFHSQFGGHQEVTLQWEYASNGRFKIGWSKNRFKSKPRNLSEQTISPGVEWFPTSKLMLSTEGLIVKPDRNYTSWTDPTTLGYGTSTTGTYDLTDNFTLRLNFNAFFSPKSFNRAFNRIPELRQQTDINVGINYHRDEYMMNLEFHKMHGGRLVEIEQVIEDPSIYNNYYVVGFNVAYFFN
jgi:hypothetical protein